jgi:hypothetical protein
MNKTNAPATTKANTQTVYYWQDGYWITDREEAELMDEINAFGSLHKLAEFPADADPAFIDAEILALLGERAQTEQGERKVTA